MCKKREGFFLFLGQFDGGGGWRWFLVKGAGLGDTGNCEINSKLLSMCVLWVRGQHQLFSGLCPLWFTEPGVGLQLGLGNTHLKGRTVAQELNVNPVILCCFFLFISITTERAITVYN